MDKETPPAVFAQGDWLVHINYGVGQVIKLERKKMDSIDTLYYRVDCDNGTFWIPVNNAGTHRVRPVATKIKFSEEIKNLKQPPKAMDTNHKLRQLYIKEVRQNGALINTVGLVRDMAAWNVSHRLNLAEQDILEEMKHRLAKEWSVVQEIEPREAQEKLDRILSQYSV